MIFASQNLRNASQIAKCEPLIRTLIGSYFTKNYMVRKGQLKHLMIFLKFVLDLVVICMSYVFVSIIEKINYFIFA